jgi:hypothetical protein
VSKDLIDPNDPLASTAELIDNAIEILDEIRYNISDEGQSLRRGGALTRLTVWR